MMNTRRYVEVSLCFTLNAMENNITSVPLLMHLPGKTITCLPKANLFCDNLSRFFCAENNCSIDKTYAPKPSAYDVPAKY